jgi:hypothetical protein
MTRNSDFSCNFQVELILINEAIQKYKQRNVWILSNTKSVSKYSNADEGQGHLWIILKSVWDCFIYTLSCELHAWMLFPCIVFFASYIIIILLAVFPFYTGQRSLLVILWNIIILSSYMTCCLCMFDNLPLGFRILQYVSLFIMDLSCRKFVTMIISCPKKHSTWLF